MAASYVPPASCRESGVPSPHSRGPRKHHLSMMSKGGVDVLCSCRLGKGQHRSGRVLSSTEPVGGFGQVDSDLVDAQSLLKLLQQPLS